MNTAQYIQTIIEILLIVAVIVGFIYEPIIAELERKLCVDSHKNCRLYYAIGSDHYDRKLRGHSADRRKAAVKQMAANRAAYKADALRHRYSVLRLTERIRNAMMAPLQPMVSRSSSGMLLPSCRPCSCRFRSLPLRWYSIFRFRSHILLFFL